MKKTTTNRKLIVRRETMKTLSRDALAAVAGGAGPRSAVCSVSCTDTTI